MLALLGHEFRALSSRALLTVYKNGTWSAQEMPGLYAQGNGTPLLGHSVGKLRLITEQSRNEMATHLV